MAVRILQGDCREVLATLPDASVHCCVTSPPYWALRSYLPDGHPDKSKEVGLEQSPAEYVVEMVAVFREVRRVLRDDGTLWLNLGDGYAGSWGAQSREHAGKHAPNVSALSANQVVAAQRKAAKTGSIPKGSGLKPKDLIGIPWRVAFALQDDGWWLRQDNIWAKRNCMPESVRDRTTRAHEYMFMLTKSARYFYDAVAIEEDGDIPAGTRAAKGGNVRSELKDVNSRPPEYFEYTGKRNKRSVWWLATEPFPEAHFAVFPAALVEPCILAGTSERGCCAACGAPWVRQVEKSVAMGSGSGKAGNKPHGKHLGSEQAESGTYDIRMGPVVSTSTTGWLPSCQCDAGTKPCVILDCFSGARTTALVADRLGRDAIGIELSADYVAMSERRLRKDAGMFADVAAQ